MRWRESGFVNIGLVVVFVSFFYYIPGFNDYINK